MTIPYHTILRKSLVKPVTWQNISSYLVLPPEIVIHDAFMLFSEHPLIYVVHDDLGWKNRTTHIVIGFGELAAVN